MKPLPSHFGVMVGLTSGLLLTLLLTSVTFDESGRVITGGVVQCMDCATAKGELTVGGVDAAAIAAAVKGDCSCCCCCCCGC